MVRLGSAHGFKICIVPTKSNAQKIKFFHATCLSEGEEPGPGDESQVEDDFHS